MIAVRPASLDDLEVVATLYTNAWRLGFREMYSTMVFVRDDFDEQRLEECRDFVTNESYDTRVAEQDGHVVGVAALRRDREVPCVAAVWVHPHSWGSGAASALLAQMEDEQRSVGTDRLVTWLPEDSPRARRLFEKAGWRASGIVGMMTHYPDEPNRTFEYTRVLL